MKRVCFSQGGREITKRIYVQKAYLQQYLKKDKSSASKIVIGLLLEVLFHFYFIIKQR